MNWTNFLIILIWILIKVNNSKKSVIYIPLLKN